MKQSGFLIGKGLILHSYGGKMGVWRVFFEIGCFLKKKNFKKNCDIEEGRCLNGSE
jgi:hypothetical protein